MMAETTKIAWCDRTFNPWMGCTKVSPGCKFCYAEELMDKRYGKVAWGPLGERVKTSPAYWRKPLAWNKESWFECVCGWRGHLRDEKMLCVACKRGASDRVQTRQRVFCASLADVFEDRKDLWDWRFQLWDIVEGCDNIDWLILTKRPENIMKMVPQRWLEDGHGFPANLWLGTSVENQETAEQRIPWLVRVPAEVLFLSVEPMLGPIEFSLTEQEGDEYGDGAIYHELLSGHHWMRDGFEKDVDPPYRGIDWVIVGGESGASARTMEDVWARSVLRQCPVVYDENGYATDRHSPAFFMKQLGGKRDKREQMDDFPEDLRVREWPR